jgi:hypothetical protein
MQTAMILTTSMLPPRKFTGSAFAALVRVPTEAATIKAHSAVSRMMSSNRTRQVLDTDAWTALQ